jgi:hypothetical protein
MNKPIFLLVGLLCAGPIQAADKEAKLLIQGCAEVEAIYNHRGEKNLLAAINTSVNEALRAGYCRGVLEQFRRGHSCYRDWIKQAQQISKKSDTQSVPQLLSDSCG